MKESRLVAPQEDLLMKEDILRDGQSLTIDLDTMLTGGEPERIQQLGIDGSLIASMRVGQQEFFIVDASQSHVAASVYQPFRNAKDKEKAELYVLDSTFPYLLIHNDPDRGLVSRAIRANEPITLGRDAAKIDPKSGRFHYQDDETLSRRHASILLEPERGIIINDLHSTNGTKVRYAVEESSNPFLEISDKVESTDPFPRGKEASATSELMKMYEFFPRQKVDVEGREFLISDVVKSKRSYAVMYTTIETNGKQIVVPRFLYKSQSDGGWRVGYGVEYPGGELRFIKEANTNEYHYTQETKLDPRIVSALEKSNIIEDPDKKLETNLLKIFNSRNAHLAEIDSRQEINYYHNDRVDAALKPVRFLSAGLLNKKRAEKIESTYHMSVGDYLQRMDYVFDDLPGFIPDFTQPPIKSEKREHTLLGSITIEYFNGQIGAEPVTWSMAYDQEGRVWVENIRLENSRVSSYGTARTVFDAGVITSKPIEYKDQCDGLTNSERTPFKGNYYDITPVLDNLLPIRQFRQSRSVLRVR